MHIIVTGEAPFTAAALRISLLLLLFLLLLGGAGCRAEKEGQARAAADGGGTERQQDGEAARERPERTLTFGDTAEGSGPDEAAGGGGETAAPEQPDESVARSRDLAFLAAGGEMVRARDAVIGVLYQGETAGETAREVYRTAREFFVALRAGEELEEFLHPAVREVLAMRLRREASGREISKLRYSRVEQEQEEARMRVRLFGEPGRSAGELLLQRHNGEWFLSAVDIDFFALEREYEPPERKASGQVGESPLNFY